MPSSIIMAVVATAASAAATYAFGTAAAWAAFSFTTSFATSLVLGGLSSLLSDKPQQQQEAPSLAYDAGNRMMTVRQAISPWRVIYGEDRVGGAVTFLMANESSNTVEMVITLACHECNAIREMYVGNELVTLDSNGRATGKYSGYLQAFYHLGDPSDTSQPFPTLVSRSQGKWTTDRHLQRGHTKVHVSITRNHDVFPTGIPNFSFVVQGYNQVYDPRDTTTKYTTNAALCRADYLVNTRFGMGLTYADVIDEDELIAAANIDDERVSLIYQPVVTFNAATDQLTFASADTQITDGDAVRYVTTVGVAGGLTSGSIYYFFSAGTTGTNGKLATTRANALAQIGINITSAGSGTQTLERTPVVTADASTDKLTFEADEKRLFTGDAVKIAAIGAGVLPTGLSGATTYYLIRVSTTVVQLASSNANALLGTAVNFTTNGSGTLVLVPQSEVRHALSGSFTLDKAPRDIITDMAGADAGYTVKIGSLWHIQAGAYEAPTETITESEMDGPRKVQVLPGRHQNANGVKGVYSGPENFYQPTDFPPVENATYVAADAGETIWRDVEFKMIRRASLARRLAKIELERTRQAMTVVLQCRLSAFRVRPGNTVGVTISRYGWTNKAFFVTNARLVVRNDGGAPRLGVDLYLRETASGVYDWAATEGTVVDIAPNTGLPNYFDVANTIPGKVSGLEIFGQGNDATFTGRDCKFTWRRASMTGSFNVGSEPSAEAGALDWFFKDYRVDVYSGSTKLRTEYVVDPIYTYTHEKNFEDTAGVPVRTFTLKAWARTTVNNISAVPAVLTVSNPAPTATTPAVDASVKGLKFSFALPSDTDWTGFKVWGSSSSGFTVDDTTVIYDGPDADFTIGNLTTDDTFYYKYAARDAFGLGSTSSESSVAPGVLILTEDLGTNSATKAASSVVSTTIDSSQYIAQYSPILFNYLSVPIDVSRPSDLIVRFNAALKASAAANNLVKLTMVRARATGRYTTGSITSITGSGGLCYLNGSGTAWLSAGLTVGDKIILGNGYPLVSVAGAGVISNTQIEISGQDPPPHSYTGSYIALLSAGAAFSAEIYCDLTAGKYVPVSIYDYTTLPSSGAYTEEMVMVTVTPDALSGSAWSATIAASAVQSIIDAFKPIR